MNPMDLSILIAHFIHRYGADIFACSTVWDNHWSEGNDGFVNSDVKQLLTAKTATA